MILEDCIVRSLQIDAHTIQRTSAMFTCGLSEVNDV